MMVRMLSPIEPRWTGMCGALAISAPDASNSAQEKSSRSLMLTEVAVDCSATPISSAMAMNRLLKISSRTGSASVPMACGAFERNGAGQDQTCRRPPARRASRARRRWSSLASIDRAAGAVDELADRDCRRQRPCLRPRWRGCNRLDRQRVERPARRPRHSRSACGAALRRRPASRRPSRSRPPASCRCPACELGAALEADLVGVEPLVDEVAAARLLQARRAPPEKSSLKRLQPARLADRLHVGEADAVGRQHAGQRVDQDPLHAQRVGDAAGMLAAGAAEAGERVAGHVMAARDRDLADRGGHIVDRDGEEALGDFLEALGRRPARRRLPAGGPGMPRDRAAGRRPARTPPGNAPG